MQWLKSQIILLNKNEMSEITNLIVLRWGLENMQHAKEVEMLKSFSCSPTKGKTMVIKQI